MITYYSVFLVLAAVGIEVRCQYQLKEYAPDHDNYETYSFSYGVSDPISGDHKHQWERMEHGHVQGEYGLMEPDGLMRLVQYTAGPKEGFQATVTKLAVQVAKPEYTLGRELYQEGGEYTGTRYAAEDNSGLQQQQGIHQNPESEVGNVQQEYVQQDYVQQTNQEDQIETDYINQESRQHAIISRAPSNFTQTDTQNRRKKDQTSSNRRKQIVKKNIESEMHLLQPGFADGGTEYFSNFNLNPFNIAELNIPNGEKQILQGLSAQQRIVPLHNPRPFTLQTLIPGIHPALINFQKEIGNSQMHGYQITPQAQNYHQIQQTLQGVNNNNRFENALAVIHNQPEVNTRLQNLHNQYNIPLQQPLIQQQNILSQYYDDPKYGPNLEGKRYNNENQTQEQKQQERQYLLGLAPLQNVPQNQQQYSNQNIPQRYTDSSQQQYSNQNIPQRYTDSSQQQYSNQNIPERYTDSSQQQYSNQNIPQQYTDNSQQYIAQPNYGQNQQSQTKLNSQNHYPVVLVDPAAKLGIPFYPSRKEVNQVPSEEFNYEGIPLFGPSLEGKRYNTENQTLEQKAGERAYLLGSSPGPIFAPPPGYTRETIWQAGDKSADPEPEILVRQLNETCAYIQFNETTPGNEDGKPNIWQAGDYSAQNQEEELIRSVNITCENYTTDYKNKFSSGYTVADYCWQCVKDDSSEYSANEQKQDGGNNGQQIGYDQNEQSNGYAQNGGGNEQQIGAQNDGNNKQQIDQNGGNNEQLGYVQNAGSNEQQIGYVQNSGNNEQQVDYFQNGGNNEEQLGYIQNSRNNEQQNGYAQNGGDNEQQIGYVQNGGNNDQQIGYVQNERNKEQERGYVQNGRNGEQQIGYPQNSANNEQQIVVQKGEGNEQQIGYVPNSENNEQQVDYFQNGGNNEDQLGYVQNGRNNAQQNDCAQNGGGSEQQIGYVQNGGNNEQQVAYVQKDVSNEQIINNEQNQYYETSAEKYAPQQTNENSQGGNYYQQGEGPMKVALYPNVGYRNDPRSGEYGLYRRSTKSRRQKIQQ